MAIEIDFPDSPAVGDLFPDPAWPTIPQWVWTGETWTIFRENLEPYVDAPHDGFTYGRKDGEWEKVLPIEGGTATGPIELPADPTEPQQAATKQYVDNRINTDVVNWVNSTLSSFVTFGYLQTYYRPASSDSSQVVAWYNNMIGYANTLYGAQVMNNVAWTSQGVKGTAGEAPPFVHLAPYGNYTYCIALMFALGGNWYVAGFA